MSLLENKKILLQRNWSSFFEIKNQIKTSNKDYKYFLEKLFFKIK